MLTSQHIDAEIIAASCNGFSAVSVRWSHEVDSAVTVLIAIPIYERRHPYAGLPRPSLWRGEYGSLSLPEQQSQCSLLP